MVTYPKDWDDLTLGDLGSIKMCRRIFSHQTEKSGQIPFYKIGTFGKKADAYISRDLYDTYRSLYSYPRKGDVLISAAGTIGRTAVFDGKDAYFQDSNIVWLDTSDDEVDSAFLKYFYESYPWQNLEGTTIRRLYNSLILSTPISLPSLPEQKAIAETLSCMDEHIANLTELIEKKKGIRDGALEDLVSGRTRLKGFAGEWEYKCLGSITSEIVTGGTPSTLISEYWGGSIPWLASTEIHQKRIIRPTTFITDAGLRYSAAKIVPKDSVLIALAGQGKTRGTAAFLLSDMAINQSLAALVADEKTNANFLFYAMERSYISLRELSSGDGGRGGLNKKLLRKFVIPYACDIVEQEEIANILSALDKEIASLEEEKDKMLQIKAGAMDDLLTGRIRLTKQGG